MQIPRPKSSLLALCVTAAAAVGLMAAGPASASTGTYQGFLKYSVYNDGNGDYIEIDGCGKMFGSSMCSTGLILPSSINGIPVTSIRQYAFQEETRLQSVTIPEGITTIGYDAFSYNANLETVSLPSTLTAIPTGAFQYDTKLASITIPAAVTDIGTSAFEGDSSLTNVIFEGNAPYVGDDPPAFGDVASGAKATLASGSLTGYGNDGDNFNGLVVTYPLPVTYTSDGSSITVTGCNGACPSTLKIPATIEGLPVTKIADGAFERAGGLTSVTIPEGVTQLGSQSFHKAQSLTSVTFPSTLTEIGAESFYEDELLANVTLPAGLTQIGDGAFANTKALASITIPEGVTYIGGYTFADSGIASVALPSSLTGLGEGAFYHASKLATVNFAGNAPSVAGNAFNGVASGATATLSSASLTGYGNNGDDFNGLTVVKPCVRPPFLAVSFPVAPTWYRQGRSGRWQIKVPVSTGGDTRGAAQPLGVQISVVANPDPTLPVRASASGHVLKYSDSFTWNYRASMRPRWIRVVTKGGKWTAWTKIERRDAP